MIEYTKHFSEHDMNKITSYLENERRVFVSTVGKIEYAAWWILRVCMIGAMVYWSKHEPGDFAITIMGFNLLATFAVPLARIIFFKKLFLGKIPFRVQSYINIFVFLGSFIGHGFKMNNVENYDKILHIISGAVTVFIGYEMLGSLKNAERTPHSVFLFGSAGFSFTVMVVWELFEFFADYCIKDSANQNYGWNPPEDMLFFKIFGYGANAPEQYAVLDTDLDMLCAVIGCAFGSAVLAAAVKLRSLSDSKKKSASDINAAARR